MNRINSNTYLSKEALTNTLLTMGAGIIGGRLFSIPLLGTSVISLITATTSNTAQAFIDDTTSSQNKGLILAGTYALTFFAAMMTSNAVNSIMDTSLTTGATTTIFAFNLLGQGIYFALQHSASQKSLFNELQAMPLDKLSADVNLNDPSKGNFSQLSPVEQHLVIARLNANSSDCSKLTPARPTAAQINALTDAQIKTLHDLQISFSTDKHDERATFIALAKRYFGLDLLPLEEHKKDSFIGVLPSLSTTQEVEDLSAAKQKWYKSALWNHCNVTNSKDVEIALFKKDILLVLDFSEEYFKTADQALIVDIFNRCKANPRRWMGCNNFMKTGLITRAKKDSIAIPTNLYNDAVDNFYQNPTVEAASKLSRDDLVLVHMYLKKSLTPDVLKELCLRFFNENLGIPRKVMGSPSIEQAHYEKIPTNQTPEEIKKLEKKQLQWIDNKIALHDNFVSLELASQIQLNTQLLAHEFNMFPLIISKESQITSLTVESLQLLQELMKTRGAETFKGLTTALMTSLNTKFKENNLDEFEANKFVFIA